MAKRTSTIEQARRKAVEILHGNLTPRGLIASRDFYPEVFCRDATLSFIGAALLGEKRIFDAVACTLTTLTKDQTAAGIVPTCVQHATGAPNFGTIDSNAWFIVLHYLHYYHTNDKALLARQYPALVRALRCLQANGRTPDDCVWSQESDDWNDLWSNHGQTLFVNVAFQAALKYMALLAGELNKRADSAEFRASHGKVKARIDEALWVPEALDKVAIQQRQQHQPALEPLRLYAMARGPMRHYMAFVAQHHIGSFCDVFSNAMAIVFGQSDTYKTGRILDYFHDAAVGEPYPCRVIYPPVLEGSPHWRDAYHGYNLNLPHQYHNGGCWTHAGGFFVAAHIKAGRVPAAEAQLQRLADANRMGKDGEWQFMEWFHAENGRPWGSRWMSWSAGMYIYAYEVLRDPQLLDVLDPALP